MPFQIQAIYGLKDEWTQSELLKWLKEHDFFPIKDAHIKGNEIRYRIRERKQSDASLAYTSEPTYTSYITKKIMVYLKYATYNKHRNVYFVLGKI